MTRSYEAVVVGGGIAGSALALKLASRGVDVAVLERDMAPIDRVRGEYMPPWGVVELHELGLLDLLVSAGGIIVAKNVPYDENTPGDAALPLARDMTSLLPDAPGAFCMSHPLMCSTLAAAAIEAGATFLRGVREIAVMPGMPPSVSFSHEGRHVEWQVPLVIGADGRNSQVRRQVGLSLSTDRPHHLMGGMLVEGVPEWPRGIQTIGNEGRSMFFVFPQADDRLRLYLCYSFDDKANYQGPQRQLDVLRTFGALKCLPYAEAIERSRPCGPFNAFSNEDQWTDDPRAQGVILIGDAAGHNDPIGGQGLSIAFRDVRLVSSIISSGQRRTEAFDSYVSERAERMRRLRMACRLASALRVEFREGAMKRRLDFARRVAVEKLPSPGMATLIGPEKVAAEAFEQSAIDTLLA